MSIAVELARQWCCLTCFSKFKMGDLLYLGRRKVRATRTRFGCPVCRSHRVMVADGRTYHERRRGTRRWCGRWAQPTSRRWI